MTGSLLPDLANVQGDILLRGFPKEVETFWFFTIANGAKFCKLLRAVAKEEISNMQHTRDTRNAIKEFKASVQATGRVPTVGANISFSAKGLKKIQQATGVDANTKEPIFEAGMKSQAVKELADPKGENSDPKWEQQWLTNEGVDGVLLVAGNTSGLVQEKLDRILKLFGDSVKLAFKESGNVRPDEHKGKEHFGYMDGISEPAVADLPKLTKEELHVPKGQDTIAQGIILCGRPGDAKAALRPEWTIDGSFLAFRKLKQNVQDFDSFLQTSANSLGVFKDQLGARLVGRWKSGCPVNLQADFDDLGIGKDKERNLDFEFDTDGIDITNINPGQALPAKRLICPIGAHIRKTNPRGDQPKGGRAAVNVHRIIRSGIPYGPEISANPNAERGLLFACYQSNLDQGFQFIQKIWANNEVFRFQGGGVDAIMGQTNDKTEVNMLGLFPQDATRPLALPGVNRFVVPRGGEYFFSPSMKALTGVLSEVKASGSNGHKDL
jgi:Dyp-type peroxidase family